MTLTDKLKQVQTRLLDIATGMYSDAPKATECCAKNALDLMPEIIKEVEASGWQDISTAPKGKWILIADAHGVGVWQSLWCEKTQHWETACGMRLLEPKKWRPLPKPPHEEK